MRDTPISEQAIVGTVLGAAVAGLRPVGEIMFADFAGVCYDQIVNQLAKYRFQCGGQVTVPATLRMAGGGSLGFGAQHSQCVENWFLNTPGLKLCVPATPADVYTPAAGRDPRRRPGDRVRAQGAVRRQGRAGTASAAGSAWPRSCGRAST